MVCIVVNLVELVEIVLGGRYGAWVVISCIMKRKHPRFNRTVWNKYLVCFGDDYYAKFCKRIL